MTAGFLKLGKTLLEGGNAEERLGAMKDLATVVFPSFLQAMFTGGSSGTPKISNEQLLAATGESDISVARKQFEKLHGGAVGFGKGIFNFGEGFSTAAAGAYKGVSGFINNLLPINQKFSQVPLLESFQKAGTQMGALLGGIAGLLAALLEAVVKGFALTYEALQGLTKDLFKKLFPDAAMFQEPKAAGPYPELDQTFEKYRQSMQLYADSGGKNMGEKIDQFNIFQKEKDQVTKTSTLDDDKALARKIATALEDNNKLIKSLVEMKKQQLNGQPR